MKTQNFKLIFEFENFLHVISSLNSYNITVENYSNAINLVIDAVNYM